MNWEALPASILLLFAIVNPIGSIPLFLQLTERMEESERRRAFRIGVLVSAVILLAFIGLGEGILTRFFQVELHDLMAAGGLLLLIIAIDHLVFGSLMRSVERDNQILPHEIGAVPIACPILAGPGAMMAVLLISSDPEAGIIVAIIAVAVVLGVTGFLLAFIDRVYKLLGRTACTVLSKILCLFIAAIGVRLMMEGLSHYFSAG